MLEWREAKKNGIQEANLFERTKSDLDLLAYWGKAHWNGAVWKSHEWNFQTYVSQDLLEAEGAIYLWPTSSHKSNIHAFLVAGPAAESASRSHQWEAYVRQPRATREQVVKDADSRSSQ